MSANSLRAALAERVVVADGAMGTMLQAANPSMADFQGHEGCNEVLNVTRPDIVRSRPSLSVSRASATTWLVNAFVDATPISGPACR